MPLSQGDLLNGRYRITDVLGHGGMGSVYHAHDESLSVEVAVKENLFTTDDYAIQFRTEAIILASLRHPNLPRVTDHFVLSDEGQYLVMDYVEGPDLRQVLEKNGVISEDEAIRVGTAICDALTYLHTRKPPVLHRDIKLGNIKLSPDGRVLLVDFGLAKVVEGDQPTMAGARAMTPGYSPPEQYGSARTDARSDVYSLGATLYAAVTGFIPEDALMRAVDGLPLTPVRKRNPKISARVAAVLEKAMETAPSNRYQTAEEFKYALLGQEYTHPLYPVPIQEEPASDTPTEEPPSQPAEIFIAAPKAISNTAQLTRTRPSWLGGVFFALVVIGVLVFALINTDPAMLPPALRNLLPQASPPAASPTPNLVGETPPTVPSTATGPATAATTTASPMAPPSATATQKATIPPATPTQQVTAVTEYPYAGHLIAFASMRAGGLPQIYTMNSDGSNQQRLFEASGGACQPAWSPDGKKLAYVSPCNRRADSYTNNTGIYIYDLERDVSLSLVTDQTSDYDPAWSPDGTMLAFTSLRNGHEQIYLIVLPETLYGSTNPAPPTLEPLSVIRLNETPANEPARQPVWSPDGKRIAYSQKRFNTWRIWMMNSDGSEQTEIIKNASATSDYLPFWAPDGARLFYCNTNPELTAPAKLMLNLVGSAESQPVSEYTPITDISLSFDGKALVFESSNGSNPDIYMMLSLGSDPIRLTDNPGVDFDPAWQP